MSGHDGIRRHSIADEPFVARTKAEIAEAEAHNGLAQFDLGLRTIEDAISKGADFRFRPSLILALHRQALEGLSSRAGNWRPADVRIENSQHQPVGAHLVPEMIEEMCDYLNAHASTKSPIHLAAYVMWRLNWIHPFTDGNGRTSRIFSYVVLCVCLRTVLGGTNTIPDQIVDNRMPYFEALEAADSAWSDGKLDVSKMEMLLAAMLAKQLVELHSRALGASDVQDI
jgi:fido (protein-threonine AMPylation protein)